MEMRGYCREFPMGYVGVDVWLGLCVLCDSRNGPVIRSLS